MAATDSPPAFSRFEFNLLNLTKFAVGHLPAGPAANLLTGQLPAPPCLTAECVKLVEDTLAKGTVLHLVRAGGWRREKFIRGNAPATGRVWERVPLNERQLTFSEAPLAFLMWLTAEKPTAAKVKWDARADDLTAADELFFGTVFEQLQAAEPGVAAAVASKRPFADNPLCRLYAPAEFADADPVAFDRWVVGERAVILECLQPHLTARWVKSERAKGEIDDWGRIRRVGTSEDRTLRDFLAACDKAGRPDLARFVLTTAKTVLGAGGVDLDFWTGGLKGPPPNRLADRLNAQRAALALPRQMDTLQAWDRKARSVGYFDDGYQVSQVWKQDWESANGDGLTATARRLIEQLEPLRT